jgi:predicted acylesterase/phospholipase RssA
MKAVAASGGGFHGALHIGYFVQLILECSETFDWLFGTSTGALCVVCIAYGKDLKDGTRRLVDMWLGLKSTKDIFGDPDPLGIGLPFAAIFKLIFNKWDGITDSGPLLKLLRVIIKGNPCVNVTVTVTSMETKERLYVTALTDGFFEVYSNRNNLTKRYPPAWIDEFRKMVLASTCVPIQSDAVKNEFVDGGLAANVPIKAALQMGATDLTVLLCGPYKEFDKWDGSRAADGTIKRAIDIMVFYQVIDALEALEHREDVEARVFASPPGTNLGSVNEFNADDVRRLIEVGRITPPCFVTGMPMPDSIRKEL